MKLCFHTPNGEREIRNAVRVEKCKDKGITDVECEDGAHIHMPLTWEYSCEFAPGELAKAQSATLIHAESYPKISESEFEQARTAKRNGRDIRTAPALQNCGGYIYTALSMSDLSRASVHSVNAKIKDLINEDIEFRKGGAAPSATRTAAILPTLTPFAAAVALMRGEFIYAQTDMDIQNTSEKDFVISTLNMRRQKFTYDEKELDALLAQPLKRSELAAAMATTTDEYTERDLGKLSKVASQLADDSASTTAPATATPKPKSLAEAVAVARKEFKAEFEKQGILGLSELDFVMQTLSAKTTKVDGENVTTFESVSESELKAVAPDLFK